MAKNKQFNKNVKKQDSKSMHSVIPKCDSDSQIMIEETMETRMLHYICMNVRCIL